MQKMQLTGCKYFLVLFFSILVGSVAAQPQWKFHVAFEDGIGARDTIWFIWDTTAHDMLPTDTVLGEGAVNFNHNVFNVWIYNYDNDSTKTFALSYGTFPSHGTQIYAFNYQYPITI